MKHIFFAVHRSAKGHEDSNACKNVVRRGFSDTFVCTRPTLPAVKLYLIKGGLRRLGGPPNCTSYK
uniref:Uncharacterized protein n=1 Tax=Physcomitrium patens TaxID=3218 RepID=A0A2K1J094_PHYPA|nr:hypothetical protein PHYPA_022840 [Physcomitrium patens]